MRNRSVLVSGVAATLVVSGTIGLAHGQEADGLGIRAGAFMVQPQTTLGIIYSDNVFAADDDEESDFITTISPSVSIDSGWSRHALGIDLATTAGIYADNSSENFVDTSIAVAGRLDVRRETAIQAQVSFARNHEERGDPNTLLENDEPAIFTVASGEAFVLHGSGRISVRAGASVQQFRYSEVDLVGGGSITQDERNNRRFEVSGRVSYELRPEVIPFVEVAYNVRDFFEQDANPVDRDSDGIRVGIGTGVILPGNFNGEVFAGWLEQDVDEEGRDISDVWFGGQVDWEVTRLTSLSANLTRTIEESVDPNVTGITQTDFTGTIDHELRRNVRLGGFLGVIDQQFEGADFDDQFFEYGARVEYLWNRHLDAEFRVSRKDRNSDEDARESDITLIYLGVTGRL